MNHPVVDMFGATAMVTLGLVKNMWLFHDQAVSQWTYCLRGVCYILQTPRCLYRLLTRRWTPLLLPASIQRQGGLTYIHTLQLNNADVWPLAHAEHLVKVYGQLQTEKDIGLAFIWSAVWRPFPLPRLHVGDYRISGTLYFKELIFFPVYSPFAGTSQLSCDVGGGVMLERM